MDEDPRSKVQGPGFGVQSPQSAIQSAKSAGEQGGRYKAVTEALQGVAGISNIKIGLFRMRDVVHRSGISEFRFFCPAGEKTPGAKGHMRKGQQNGGPARSRAKDHAEYLLVENFCIPACSEE